MKKILVVNAMGYQGYKVTNFLNNQGHNVIAVDRYFQEDKNKANKFFKLDLKHKDSVKLLSELCKPEILVFCAEQNSDEYRDVVMLNNITGNIDTLKSLILSLDYVPTKVDNLNDLIRYNLVTLIRFYSIRNDANELIITSSDNLLKSIKSFLLRGGGVDGEKNN